MLRESFSSKSLEFLRVDIPIMALTATATIHVREDILKSLRLSKEAKVVLTSFFRPNLQFSVRLVFQKTLLLTSVSHVLIFYFDDWECIPCLGL